MNEIYQNEIYILVDSDKFVEKLLNLDEDITLMAEKIGVEKDKINNWLDQDYNPLSKNIFKIMQVYNLTCEDLGAEAIKIEDTFGTRLKYLLNKKKLNQKQFAEMLSNSGTKTSETTVSNWCKDVTLPPLEKVIDIANFFGVSYLYLLGVIKHENVSDLIIKELDGVNDETANNIVFLLKSNIYGDVAHKIIKEKYGFDYIDILEFLTQNKKIFDMFYFEVYKSIKYYSDSSYFREFEKFYNGYDNMYEDVADSADSTFILAPYKVNQQEFSKSLLQNIIGKIFDEFVEKIILEKNFEKVTYDTLCEEDNEFLNEAFNDINSKKRKNKNTSFKK